MAVLWAIGTEAGTSKPSTIPGHTALPRTFTYQEVLVDSYTNLSERYQCGAVLANETVLQSIEHEPQIECKHTIIFIYSTSHRIILMYIFLSSHGQLHK